MISIARTRAENRFAALEKRQQVVLSEHEETARTISENTARLRALRLAKEAGGQSYKEIWCHETGSKAFAILAPIVNRICIRRMVVSRRWMTVLGRCN